MRFKQTSIPQTVVHIHMYNWYNFHCTRAHLKRHANPNAMVLTALWAGADYCFSVRQVQRKWTVGTLASNNRLLQ